jgi:glycosyltransferase involved in cell wall biosynthesis
MTKTAEQIQGRQTTSHFRNTALELLCCPADERDPKRSNRALSTYSTRIPRALSQPTGILLITDSFPPLVGGAGRDTDLLARALVARGHRVCVATSEQPGAPRLETTRDGFEVHRLPGLTTRMHWLSASLDRRIPPPFPDPETTWRLRRLIRSFKPDVVHSYGWMTYSCWLAMAGLGARLVVSARDYGLICPVRTLLRRNEICSGPAPGKCLTCSSSEYGIAKGMLATTGILSIRRSLARHCTAVHSVSRYADERMVHDFIQPAGSAALHQVIPCFAADDHDERIDEEAMSRLPAGPFVLYVGALRLCKGIDILVDAHGRLPDAPPLVLLGSRAPDTPACFPRRVRVVPPTNHATVMASWDRALFAVAPSRWPEPFGNVVHEAMSCGKAVIGTYPGGHEDMIDPGRNGMLVPAGDTAALTSAMQYLLANPAERDRLGKAARQASARFTSELVAPAFEELYSAALARP